MTDLYLFRKVVISLELLFSEIAFFHLHLANMCSFRPKEIVSTNKMINISKNLGISQFTDRTRTHLA